MNSGSAIWRKGCILEAVLFALLAVSCGASAMDTPSPTATPVPTPTTTAAPQDGTGLTAPDPSTLPEAAAPQGLGRAILPVNAPRITSKFRGLQWNLSSRQRTPGLEGEASGDISVSYGRTQPVGCGIVGLTATNVSTGEFYPPEWTAENIIAHFTTGADWEVEDFGREGPLHWVRWYSTCSSADSSATDDLFMISWGNAGSPWVFSALADNPEERDELVAAFVREFR